MYPLFYREYAYKINITIDDFIQKINNDLFITSSNAYWNEKNDRKDKHIPLQGEINTKKNIITNISINANARGQTTAKINLEYYMSDELLNVKFTIKESILQFILINFAIFILILFILPLKGVLIFLITFYPLLILRYIHPYFENTKRIIHIFEEYFLKQGIECVKVKIVKYSIIDFIFKKVKI